MVLKKNDEGERYTNRKSNEDVLEMVEERRELLNNIRQRKRHEGLLKTLIKTKLERRKGRGGKKEEEVGRGIPCMLNDPA